MQTHTNAPNLTNVLTSMPSQQRLRVMDALLNKPLTQGEWLGRGGAGCFMTVASQAVAKVSRREIKRNPEQVAAEVLGITERQVIDAFTEWDNLSGEDVQNFLSGIRREADKLRLQSITSPVTGVRRATQLVREIVAA